LPKDERYGNGTGSQTMNDIITDIAAACRTPPKSPLSEDVGQTLARLRAGHRFVKALPLAARVLDMGAGEGSLPNVARWLEPVRNDLEFYAVSLEVGKYFDRYAGVELVNFDSTPPSFPGVAFDAVFASHFIEHIADPEAFFAWARSRLNPGGLLYVECPAVGARTAPTLADLKAAGVSVIVGNFLDDRTHKAEFRFDEPTVLVDAVKRAGFDVLEHGVFHLPMIEEALLYYGHKRGDPYLTTMGLWSKTQWAHHVIARSPRL
jgi:SAM-dependent methyltransferase